MNRVHITAYDCITCFGHSLNVLWQNLLAGNCGFSKVRRFATDNYVNQLAGCISCLDEIEHGNRFPALIDILLDGVSVSPDAILLTASTKDNIELLEKAVRTGASVGGIDTLGSIVRHKSGITDIGRNVNTACASGSTALMLAAEMIRSGDAQEVVVCGADLVSEFVYSGFSALKAMTSGTCRPFDINRDGLILGETAGYIVLMSESRLQEKNIPGKGELVGWGGASDAVHITAPDRQAGGLVRAIEKALLSSSLEKDLIGAVNAHGTGTIYNDSMELSGLSKIYGDDIPYVYSIKGAIGHSLGPCGLIEVMVSLKSLEMRVSPPTVGCCSPEDILKPAMANSDLTKEYVLSINSGFGGINTALVLGKEKI